jgi:ATP-dependent phosphofructokinase / diphosphate-dependent phosphofructokinase
MARSTARCIGLLTSGGDCPGLNAAIRAITKVAIHEYGIRVVGIQDGFRGLVENRTLPLDESVVSGILTRGGTILGASRDKPHSMPVHGELHDMTDQAVETVREHRIDCLVCLGGGGTAKNAYRLAQKGGIDVMTLPKTIDNDVYGTDVSFGFDTAVGIATDAIDRLHTTATSHHRMIICEIMGHRAGWLGLQSGVAGGADVILIPEIPYDLQRIAEYMLARRKQGKRFSIIAAAEGAKSVAEVQEIAKAKKKAGKADDGVKERRRHAPRQGRQAGEAVPESEAVDAIRADLPLKVRRMHREVMAYHAVQEPMATRLARQLQELTGVEARVTSLGHVQRGGPPSAFDRALCTQLGAKAADLLARGKSGVMVAYKNGRCVPVPLEDVVGRRKPVPLDDPLLDCARKVGTCMGD